MQNYLIYSSIFTVFLNDDYQWIMDIVLKVETTVSTLILNTNISMYAVKQFINKNNNLLYRSGPVEMYYFRLKVCISFNVGWTWNYDCVENNETNNLASWKSALMANNQKVIDLSSILFVIIDSPLLSLMYYNL